MGLITDSPSRLSVGLGLKAYRDILVFRGRSTRTEVVSLYFVSVLIGIALNAVLLPLDLSISLTHALDAKLPSTMLVLALEAIPYLPFVALSSRRAHDVGIYGPPIALIALATIAAGFWHDLHFRTTGVDLPPDWIEYPRVIGVLIFYAMLLWPAPRGANRFGPDPRGPDHWAAKRAIA